MVLRPGGTYDSSPAIYRRVRKHIRPVSRRDARIPPLKPMLRGSVFAKLNRFSHEISVVPPGTRANSNTGTGDKSPAYFPFVPPGQTAPATALLNAEMCNGDRFEILLIFAPLHQSLTWCTRAGGSFPPPSSRGRTEPLPDCQTPHVY
jgi:hypothetical protein